MSQPMDGTPAGIIELGGGGVVVAANAHAASILGVPADELVGRTIALTEDAAAQPSSGRWSAVGGPATLDLFADLSSFALFSQDADGRIASWNRGAERILGYTSAEIVGAPIARLAPPHLRADLEALAARIAAGERFDRVFTEMQRKDGMPVPIALSVSPMLDASGAFLGAAAVAQELTESRLAQAALAEVEQRFQEWESLAHVGRWLWDVGTDAIQWSDELHRMHGVDPLEFEGTLTAHLAVVHPDDRQRVRELMEAAVADGTSFEDEYRVGGDTSVRWFAIRAEPAIGSSGDVVGLRGVSQDITVNAIRR